MPTGEIVDWIFRSLFAILAVLWGRSQKQADTLVETKAQDLQRLARHDREAMTVLITAKTAALDDKGRALERLFESQLALRDQRIDELTHLTERAMERFSKEGGRITEKIEEHRDRLTKLEEWRQLQ